MYRLSFLAVLLTVIAVTPALAQRNNPRSKPMQASDVTAEGTIVSVHGIQIALTTATNQQVKAICTQQTEVAFKATANPDFLRKNLSVEFVADLDEKGQGKDPISNVTIIAPLSGRQAGLFGEGAVGSKKASDPGILGNDSDTKGKKKKKNKKADSDDLLSKSTSAGVKLPAVCTVRGKIKSVHGNTMTVSAGRTSVTVTLGDSPQIDVDLSDLSAASPGDKIKLWGKSFGGQYPTMAEKIEIEAAQALSGGKTKPGKTKDHASKLDKGEKAEPAEKPAKKAAKAKTEDVLGN